MKEIRLTKGYVAMVDDEDYEWLSQYKWWASVGHNVYARANVNGERVKMHRLIMNASPEEQVDHINNNTLCNLRENLRICTSKENARNRRSSPSSTSKYVGVGLVTVRRRSLSRSYTDWYWRAYIRVDDKLRILLSTKDEVEAAMVRDIAALRHFGNFAHLNFPEKLNDYLCLINHSEREEGVLNT